MTGLNETTAGVRSQWKGAFGVTTGDDSLQPPRPEAPDSREPAINHADTPRELLRTLAEDRDRIARDLNDTLVRRMFAVSLDLHAALGRIGSGVDDQLAAEKIRNAIGGLDQAIKDLRRTVAGLDGHGASQPPRSSDQ